MRKFFDPEETLFSLTLIPLWDMNKKDGGLH